MLERVLIAGSGGQGIVFLGKLLAHLAVDTLPHVTFFPCYGAEVRGGTSNCQIILSSQTIASPLAEVFDSLLLMNQQSADRFFPLLADRGIALINRSLCDIPGTSRVIRIPATELADQLGNVRAANLVMLGAWLKHKPLISPAVVEKVIAHHIPDISPDLIAINIKAFQAGLSSDSKPVKSMFKRRRTTA